MEEQVLECFPQAQEVFAAERMPKMDPRGQGTGQPWTTKSESESKTDPEPENDHDYDDHCDDCDCGTGCAIPFRSPHGTQRTELFRCPALVGVGCGGEGSGSGSG
ncbi:uncharacterized protein DMAD_10194 [Drosophila madeirensis]|uniref:Uncharacterized protein n=1 Tax=Drosophila madeirensis TaxID=30013 RepID=A0AAU9F8P6_DROMD